MSLDWSRRFIATDSAAPPGGAFSQAVSYGPMVYTAGQVGRDPSTGAMPATFEGQIRLAVQNLAAVLAAAGSSLDDVIKTSCFLADIRDFREFDAIYRDLFSDPPPARSTVGVALADGLLFEIEAIAVVKQST